MAQHQSAKKRSRQTLKKTIVNKILMTKLKTKISLFNNYISEKNPSAAQESLSLLNSAFSRAVKRNVIRKGYVSRKLSSLSRQLKKIL